MKKGISYVNVCLFLIHTYIWMLVRWYKQTLAKNVLDFYADDLQNIFLVILSLFVIKNCVMNEDFLLNILPI